MTDIPDTLAALMPDVLDRIKTANNHRLSPLHGIPTGLPDLDALTWGLTPGNLHVIASRPGMGRTALLTNLCRASAITHGLPTAVYTLEEDHTRFVCRVLSAEARISRESLQKGLLDERDLARLAEHVSRVAKAPLHVKTPPAITMEELAADAARLVEEHRIQLLAVDGIHDVKPEKTSDLREREVGDVARGLKTLARELGIPVVATAHLNRSPEQRPTKRPKLDDLRESGAITFAADVIILLHRDDYYEPTCSRAGEADLIVAKHRHGQLATIIVAAQLHYGRFATLAVE